MQRHFAKHVVVADASDDCLLVAASDSRAHTTRFDLFADVVELVLGNAGVGDDDHECLKTKKARGNLGPSELQGVVRVTRANAYSHGPRPGTW